MDSIRCGYKRFNKAVCALLKNTCVRLLLITFACTAIIGMLTGAAVAKYAIVINDGISQIIVYTSEDDPETILYQENIQLSPHDEIEFSGVGEDNQGSIDIHRGKRICITADGRLSTVYMARGTVKDALEKARVTVGEEDLINVSLSEQINSDMDIEINRVTYRDVTEVRAIAFETVEFPTQTLAKGKTRVLRAGRAGEMELTSEQKLIDGVVTEEKLVDMEVTKAAVSKRMLVGDPKAPASQLIPDEPIKLDANGNPVSYLRKVTGKATAYSALGRSTSLKPGNVAMDLSEFPRGTRLYIKTPSGSFVYGYSEVKDTGHAANNGTILVDLFFGSYRESCLFGAKTVDVYVLE